MLAATSKGQTTSLEFFIVSGVVVMAITASFVVYDLTSSRTQDAHSKIEMELIATDIIDYMIKSNGNPGKWEDNPSSTLSFGLVGAPVELDIDKVNAFTAFDYDTSKQIMEIDNFDYFFAVRTTSGSTLAQSGVTPTDADIVVNPRMVAVLNDDIVFVDFLLWR